jgi:D-psicose/D-tagatose/L-ribulose 3-epimerase
MKFAANALIWTTEFDHRSFPILPQLREHGFDGFELAMFEPVKLDTRSIRRALGSNDLECTVCSILPAGMNPISEKAEIRHRTRQHLIDSIKATADLGSTLMAGPIYSPVGHLSGRRRTHDEWRWAIDCFQALGDTLRANQVTLALEPLNRFETYFLNTAADAAKLCEDIAHPNIGVLLDTFHTNIEEKDVLAAFTQMGKRLKHIHACENDRGIPGTGHVDFSGIAAALKLIGYSEWITIESFGYSHKELAAAAAIWRDLAPTPEAVAFEGLRFLKRVMS